MVPHTAIKYVGRAMEWEVAGLADQSRSPANPSSSLTDEGPVKVGWSLS
jgi:hypothetical protein